MVLGIVKRKAFWVFLIVLIGVWIPYGLSKIGIQNEYVSFLTNPFYVFAILMICMSIYLYKFFKPSWISLLLLSGMILGAFTYVYVFYMM